jgi:hypothetical protein
MFADGIFAEALVFAFLEEAEELRLDLHGKVADFVEKQRAPFGHFETAFLGGMRAGEGAFLVAEQLRLDEILRQRRAAHFDERLLGPR